jgi:hypothetical protein
LKKQTQGGIKMVRRCGWIFLLVMIITAPAAPARAQDDQMTDLAKKLANPVANLVSVPLQYNYDEYSGVNKDASVSRLIAQPVIPIKLNEDWLLITRTLIPLVDQSGFPLPAMNESGLGDIAATQYFSPTKATAGGLIWGVGPAEILPTASEDALGTGKWSIGPTLVLLKQSGPWTAGYLGSHVWSVAGDEKRDNVNATSMQPFISYNTKTYTTFAALTETVYDWNARKWQVPVILMVGQMLKIGPQIMQLAVGGKYWAEAPDNGPDGWGIRVQLTFVFPK